MPRFTLDKRKPRGRYKTKCPKCGDIKSFVCVVDTTTGEPVDASRFGVCDHERRCGYSCWPTGKDVGGMSIIVSSNEVKKEFLVRDGDIANVIDSEDARQTDIVSSYSLYLRNYESMPHADWSPPGSFSRAEPFSHP